MLNSIWILNTSGEIVIEKHWRGLQSRAYVDEFWKEVSKCDLQSEVAPVIPHAKGFYIHIQRPGLFFLCTVSGEGPPLMTIEFLTDVYTTFKDYFKKVDETTLKMNFVTVYQLLDEMMDNGIPFNTSLSLLRDMIAPPTLVKDIVDRISGPSKLIMSMPTMGSDAYGAKVSWRKRDIKHTPNEIYLDIVESIDATLDAQGMILNSDVAAEVLVSCKLSGMPDLSLVFQNARILDDVAFHRCVRYKTWEGSRVVSFVPPDGDFRLMTYRVKTGVHIPIYVRPQIHFGTTGGSVSVMVGPKHLTDKTIEDLSLVIPFPQSLSGAKVSLESNFGRVQYDEMTKICRWDIGKLPKEKSPLLTGNISFGAGQKPPESRPIIQVGFTVSMWSASGIKVDSLNMRHEDYKPYKGVRTVTKAGRFEVRC